MLHNIPITVLMTTYNCGQFIKTSINSILNQNYKNFELLIIDDGSDDNTGDVIKEVNSDKIRYIWLEHIGRSAALNYGLKVASFEWVALMDADDLAAPERLEKEISLINGNNQNIIFSDSVYFMNNKIQFLNMVNPEKEDMKRKIELRGHICNSSVVYNRNFILENGGYNEKLVHSEDHELWIRLLNKGNFIHVNDWLIFMRIRKNSLSTKVNDSPPRKISIFDGSNNPMIEKKIGILRIGREYMFRKKVKLRVKYFLWKYWNYKAYISLSEKLSDLSKSGAVFSQ
ncbi:MAG: glycosyltransferase [Ignavibacteriaceae bacterium]|nr:glycosyltransferase [Ignavibacteriaceae bacterium]